MTKHLLVHNRTDRAVFVAIEPEGAVAEVAPGSTIDFFLDVEARTDQPIEIELTAECVAVYSPTTQVLLEGKRVS